MPLKRYLKRRVVRKTAPRKKTIGTRVKRHLKKRRGAYLVGAGVATGAGVISHRQGKRRKSHATAVSRYVKKTGGTKSDAKRLFKKTWRASGHGQFAFSPPKRRKKTTRRRKTSRR